LQTDKQIVSGAIYSYSDLFRLLMKGKPKLPMAVSYLALDLLTWKQILRFLF